MLSHTSLQLAIRSNWIVCEVSSFPYDEFNGRSTCLWYNEEDGGV